MPLPRARAFTWTLYLDVRTIKGCLGDWEGSRKQPLNRYRIFAEMQLFTPARSQMPGEQPRFTSVQ